MSEKRSYIFLLVLCFTGSFPHCFIIVSMWVPPPNEDIEGIGKFITSWYNKVEPEAPNKY